MRLLLLLTAALPAALPTRADAQWVEEFRHGPFIFRSEFPVSRSPLLRDLTQLRNELQRTLQIRVNDDPIELNFFASRRSYVRFLEQRVPEGVRRRALYVKGDGVGRLYAYKNRHFDTDVRHECTHALLHNALPFIPLWMDEGLAEYYESRTADRANPARMRATRWSARLGWRPDLEELEASDTINDLDANAYRDSWAWIHFLLHESDQSRQVLVAYLGHIQKGNPPGPFSAFCRRSLPDSEKRLVRHFRRLAL